MNNLSTTKKISVTSNRKLLMPIFFSNRLNRFERMIKWISRIQYWQIERRNIILSFFLRNKMMVFDGKDVKTHNNAIK